MDAKSGSAPAADTLCICRLESPRETVDEEIKKILVWILTWFDWNFHLLFSCTQDFMKKCGGRRGGTDWNGNDPSSMQATHRRGCQRISAAAMISSDGFSMTMFLLLIHRHHCRHGRHCYSSMSARRLLIRAACNITITSSSGII